MRDLNLKGIARRFLGETGAFSVVQHVFRTGHIDGTVSLRERLETIARVEHDYRMRECVFRWDAAYEQTWTHIVIRVRLRPKYNVSLDDLTDSATVWRRGIEAHWNNQCILMHEGELSCRFSFHIDYVTDNEHHKVKVRNGNDVANMKNWYIDNGGQTAAHEFGHMFGRVDEYWDGDCPEREHITNTIMGSGNLVPPRLMGHFATFLGGYADEQPP